MYLLRFLSGSMPCWRDCREYVQLSHCLHSAIPTGFTVQHKIKNSLLRTAKNFFITRRNFCPTVIELKPRSQPTCIVRRHRFSLFIRVPTNGAFSGYSRPRLPVIWLSLGLCLLFLWRTLEFTMFINMRSTVHRANKFFFYTLIPPTLWTEEPVTTHFLRESARNIFPFNLLNPGVHAKWQGLLTGLSAYMP